MKTMANGTGRDRDRFSGCVKITLARDVNERRKEARKGAAALAFRNFVCGKYLNKVTNREMRMFLRKLGRGVVARISLAMKRLPPMFKLKPKNIHFCQFFANARSFSLLLVDAQRPVTKFPRKGTRRLDGYQGQEMVSSLSPALLI